MMQIIYIVMAIGLGSLIAFGGINYFDSDAPSKLIISRGLTTQYEALTSGISNYRASNNGLAPDSIEQFKGYLPKGAMNSSKDGKDPQPPSFGTISKSLTWSVTTEEGKSIVCVEIPTAKDVLVKSALSFARDAKAKNADPRIGSSCGDGVDYVDGMTLPTSPSIFITLKGA